MLKAKRSPPEGKTNPTIHIKTSFGFSLFQNARYCKSFKTCDQKCQVQNLLQTIKHKIQTVQNMAVMQLLLKRKQWSHLFIHKYYSANISPSSNL